MKLKQAMEIKRLLKKKLARHMQEKENFEKRGVGSFLLRENKVSWRRVGGPETLQYIAGTMSELQLSVFVFAVERTTFEDYFMLLMLYFTCNC